MAGRPPIMKHRPTSRRRRSSTRSVLRLLDLEHSKTAVLNSLTSQDAQRGYRHAIDEFVDWYCSEPRLAFNRIVVLRYRSHLESRQLAQNARMPWTVARNVTKRLRQHSSIRWKSIICNCSAGPSLSQGHETDSFVLRTFSSRRSPLPASWFFK
jgi:hypothetical protein